MYHITKNGIAEKCNQKCNIGEKLHFESLSNALINLELDFMIVEPLKGVKVSRYIREINYKSGLTEHYQYNRAIRETELVRRLGEGMKIGAFKVDMGKENVQIHELLDNGVMNVYSYFTHKKITLFAPTPMRIMSLYVLIGELPPDFIIEKSECNVRKGHNEIFL